MIAFPTALTAPDDIIKETHMPLPSNSDVLLPSTNEKTTPQIIPNGSPFKSMKIQLYGCGTAPKRINVISATKMANKIQYPRLFGFNSETIFIPANLEIVYPMACNVMSIIL